MGGIVRIFLKLGSILFLTLATLVGCGGSSGKSGGGGSNNPPSKPVPANRVNWAAVPREFNPKTEDIEFRTDGFEKINIDAYGFRDDVEVVYTSAVPAGSGYLRIFKVYKDTASWGNLQLQSNGTSLDLKNFGTYQCSISITNGQITALKGGCYVRLQVFLPVGSEVEVYNVGQLITKRFIPMKTTEFLTQLDRATRGEEKFAVIENFLGSYSGMRTQPSLTAQQLGVVVGEFAWKEEKFKAMGMLRTYISDRENLGQMIEDKFNHFDREEARRIVGL